MKTTNNVTKTYKVKSSAIRWAKKNIGSDWAKKGIVCLNLNGTWFYKENKIESPKETGKIVDRTFKTKAPIVHKSTIGSPCRVVWDIAEEMEGAKRKDVIAECVRKGIAFYTARTQYQKYREALKAAGVLKADLKISA
jgi:hypothetical protein